MIDNAKLFEANATVTLRRSKLRPGKYTLPKDMTNGGAIEALMQGPKAKVVKTFKFTLPEGRSRRENDGAGQEGPVRGRLREGDQRDAAFLRRAHDARAAAEGEEPRGLPVPRDLRDGLRRERQRPRRSASSTPTSRTSARCP